MIKIALIDYGAGNLTSVRKGLRAAGAEVFTPDDPSQLGSADAIVVPGVGHFHATSALGPSWREAILARTTARVPLLGICLGMQWLYEGSDEAPAVPGLGLLDGRCTHIRDLPEEGDAGTEAGATGPPLSGAGLRAGDRRATPRVKVPHVGWNALSRTGIASSLLEGVADDAYVYFTHSYAAPLTVSCVAQTTHGRRFAAVVERDRVFGVQFHPEKSGAAGLQMLQNFVAIASIGG